MKIGIDLKQLYPFILQYMYWLQRKLSRCPFFIHFSNVKRKLFYLIIYIVVELYDKKKNHQSEYGFCVFFDANYFSQTYIRMYERVNVIL